MDMKRGTLRTRQQRTVGSGFTRALSGSNAERGEKGPWASLGNATSRRTRDRLEERESDD